jgi:hypothetical protein
VNRQRTFVICYLCLLILLWVIGRTNLLRDGDTFWHVAVGRKILAERALVYHDPFTFTFEGQPWVANQWLSECLMAGTDRVAGLDGLLLLSATVIAAVFGQALCRLVGVGLHPLLATLSFAIFFASSASNLHARPHLATFALLSVTFGLLLDVEDERCQLRRLWILVPLFIVWANLHGGILGGLGTLCLVAGGWAIRFLVLRSGPLRTRRQLVELSVLVMACGLAILVTPYGKYMSQAWAAILGMDLPNLVIEHAPLDPRSPFGIMTLAAGFFFLSVLLSTGRRVARVCWWVPSVWLLLACLRHRHAPLFSITAFLALASMLRHSRVLPLLERRGFFRRQPEDGLRHDNCRGAMPWLLVTVSLLGGLSMLRGMGSADGPRWASPDPFVWPASVRPCLDAYVRGQPAGTKVFNEVNYGGFLIYNYPELRVFIDGRCELFGEPFLWRYLAAKEQPQILDEWYGQYDFAAALVQRGSLFDQQFAARSQWVRRCDSDSARLYTRTVTP